MPVPGRSSSYKIQHRLIEAFRFFDVEVLSRIFKRPDLRIGNDGMESFGVL